MGSMSARDRVRFLLDLQTINLASTRKHNRRRLNLFEHKFNSLLAERGDDPAVSEDPTIEETAAGATESVLRSEGGSPATDTALAVAALALPAPACASSSRSTRRTCDSLTCKAALAANAPTLR